MSGHNEVGLAHFYALHRFAVETERAMLLLEIRVTDLWASREVRA